MTAGAGIGIISQDELRAIRGKAEGGSVNNAAIITRGELERIKAETIIKSDAQIKAERKLLNAQKEEQFMANTKRKEKMGGFDKTRPNQMTMMKSVMTKVGPGPDALLTKANEQMDEQLDDVKHMNHLMLQSKVITIRDKQLAENKSLEDEWLAEQKRLDIMMEIERLKGIKAEFEKEQNKAIATKRGAENLIDQIRERDIIRQQEAEVLEKEKVQMKANIAKAHEEEALKVKERLARVKVMQEEIKAANKAALSLKEDAKKREKQLEDEIMAHQKNKILREEAEAREVARVKEEKERETQRLREL